MRAVLVRWNDITGDSSWQTLTEAEANETTPMVTAGFLLSDGDGVLRVAGTVQEGEEDPTVRLVGDVTVIPLGAVESVQVMEGPCGCPRCPKENGQNI